jgi:hypothetical protein
VDLDKFVQDLKQVARMGGPERYLDEYDEDDCELIEARYRMLQEYMLNNNILTTVLDKACKKDVCID